MPLLNAADNVFIGDLQVIFIALGQIRVWPPATGSQPIVTNVSSSGTLTVSWDETDFAQSYELRRNGVLISTQESRIYNDSGLEWGSSYFYTVTPISFGIPGDESPPSINALIPEGEVGDVSASSRSLTNVTISWTAVPGATHYDVTKDGVVLERQTTLSRAIAVTADTNTSLGVRAVRNGVVGPWTKTYTYYSGKAQVKDIGSKTEMVFAPSRVDSWRPIDAWAYLTNIAAQGYYTARYGNYKGVIYYGSTGVRDSLRAKLGGGTLGANRQDKGTCTSAQVYLYKKTGVGSWGAVSFNIYRSNSTASGAEPSGVGGVTLTSTKSGVGQYYNIGTAHGQAIGDATYKSLMTAMDGATNYAQFTNGTLKLSWSWNYVLEEAKANTWT